MTEMFLEGWLMAYQKRIQEPFQTRKLQKYQCSLHCLQTAWFAALDATKWLHHVSGLIKAAVRVATALDVEGRPVIVHCSDGWDRYGH